MAKKASGKKTAAKRAKKERQPTVIAQQLREAIKASGMSLPEIAEAADIGYAVLYRFTTGLDIRLETAGRIAAVVGLEFCKQNTK